MLLRDAIYDTLRAEILSCILAPGEELRELDLAEKYEVSRSPVREALRRLEADRLVRVLPRQCYVITAISLTEATDIYRFRAVLEPACAAETARRASEAELAALAGYARPSPADPVVLNRDFHCAVARACGNKRMADTACDLIEQSHRLILICGGRVKEQIAELFGADHDDIASALANRNARGARRLLQEHIDQTSKHILGALRRQAVHA